MRKRKSDKNPHMPWLAKFQQELSNTFAWLAVFYFRVHRTADRDQT